jgi:hypothetical protein
MHNLPRRARTGASPIAKRGSSAGVAALVTLAAMAVVATPAASQQRASLLSGPAAAEPARSFRTVAVGQLNGVSEEPPALHYVIAGGVIAGALGAVAATAAGGDFDFRYPAAGAALASPVGVHLADRRRGNLLLGALASAAIGAGFILHGSTGPHTLLASAPIAVTASIMIERLTGQ